jgi:heme A synthase
MNFAHRFLALSLGILVLLLATAAWRRRDTAPLIGKLAGAAVAIYAVQVIIGASNVWTELADWASTLHLAVGTLLWVTIGVMNIRIHRLHELLRPRSVKPADAGLAGVTR